jgi:hypothetical protein
MCLQKLQIATCAHQKVVRVFQVHHLMRIRVVIVVVVVVVGCVRHKRRLSAVQIALQEWCVRCTNATTAAAHRV